MEYYKRMVSFTITECTDGIYQNEQQIWQSVLI